MPSRADLDAAIAQLTTAVTTSGRERAAHSMLAPAVQVARERAWRQREDTRPAEPIPVEHQRHQRALENAKTGLSQARELATTLVEYRRRLEEQRDGLPFWASGRRQQLTALLKDTVQTGRQQWAIESVEDAERDVRTAALMVETDTRQRVADVDAERRRRHEQWLKRGPWPSTGLDPEVAWSSHGDRAPTREAPSYEMSPTLAPPSPGPGLSL